MTPADSGDITSAGVGHDLLRSGWLPSWSGCLVSETLEAGALDWASAFPLLGSQSVPGSLSPESGPELSRSPRSAVQGTSSGSYRRLRPFSFEPRRTWGYWLLVAVLNSDVFRGSAWTGARVGYPARRGSDSPRCDSPRSGRSWAPATSYLDK